MSEADHMLAHAAGVASDLAAPELDAHPRRRVAVLACMDARVDLHAILGLAPGDAHVIRNAGGLATDDALRSLSASQRLLGTQEIVVVMHEDCGLEAASDDQFADMLEADGADPPWRLGAFTDLEDALQASLARLRSAPELSSREMIRGLIYAPATGRLCDVERGGGAEAGETAP